MLCLELELICWNCRVLSFKSPLWISGVWNQAPTRALLTCTQKSTKQIRHSAHAASFKIRVKRWLFFLCFHLFFPGFELFLFHAVFSQSMLLCPLRISVSLLYGCVQCTDLFIYPFSQRFIYFHSCCYQCAPPFPLSLRWGGAGSS